MDKKDSQTRVEAPAARRRVLQMMGTTAVAVPVLGLSACGGDSGSSATSSEPAPMPAKAPEPSVVEETQTAMEDAAATAQDEMAAAADMADETADAAMGEMRESADAMAGEAEQAADMIASDMPQVDENGAQAMGLGYRHDATTVDASMQTRYQAGQQCANCVLFQGGDAEWGGCPLFAGKVVKRTGWCSAYSAAG